MLNEVKIQKNKLRASSSKWQHKPMAFQMLITCLIFNDSIWGWKMAFESYKRETLRHIFWHLIFHDVNGLNCENLDMFYKHFIKNSIQKEGFDNFFEVYSEFILKNLHNLKFINLQETKWFHNDRMIFNCISSSSTRMKIINIPRRNNLMPQNNRRIFLSSETHHEASWWSRISK